MCRLAALAGDLALLCLIHGTEAPLAADWHSFASFQLDDGTQENREAREPLMLLPLSI
jgi:hypothetical protein